VKTAFLKTISLLVVMATTPAQPAALADELAGAAASTEGNPALHLKVLDSVEVKFPDHSLFYQRVEPAPAPAPTPVAKSLSLAESSAADARQADGLTLHQRWRC
jgi:hypothetical protein